MIWPNVTLSALESRRRDYARWAGGCGQMVVTQEDGVTLCDRPGDNW
jgi:hypothetical protein